MDQVKIGSFDFTKLCSHGKRDTLGSSPGRATIFTSPMTFDGAVWVRSLGNDHQKLHVSLFLISSEQIQGQI